MLGGERGVVDGVVTSAHIEGVGVGQEWFCFEGEQLFDESGETGGLYVGGVALFADVDFDGVITAVDIQLVINAALGV